MNSTKPLTSLASLLCACAFLPPAGSLNRVLLQNEPTEQLSRPSLHNRDSSTLKGKVMVAYNGWYNTEQDGGGSGWAQWTHDSRMPIQSDNVSVEVFPDLSEFGPEERFSTKLQKTDGTPVEVFSSLQPNTVKRHFKWMKDYDIDGAFVKRRAQGLKSDASRQNTYTVLANARAGAKASKRVYAVLYDLRGLKAGEMPWLMEDWAYLSESEKVTDDKHYLNHNGKPLVAIMGIDFNNQDYTLEQCQELVDFFKDKGCSLLLGALPNWKSEIQEKALLAQILNKADVISPWTVRRIQSPKDAAQYGRNVWAVEREWCESRGIDYMPVLYPGYSRSKTGLIVHRRHGKFLWAQFMAAKQAECSMALVATFDGMRNGTAILKLDKNTNNARSLSDVPTENIPSDYYLKLTGAGARQLKSALAKRNGQLGLASK